MENELLQGLLSAFSTEVVTVVIIGVFTLLFFVLMQVAKRFSGNEKASALIKFFNMIDDVLYDAIVEVALSPRDVEAAKTDAERYARELGFDIDYRMVAVLRHAENFIEQYLPIDVDLPLLYARAERIYQEVSEGMTTPDVDDIATESVAERIGLN